MAAPKISVYSLPDLKNTTDDVVPNYLTSLKFVQNHSKANVRLLLGYTAVIIAGVTFYFDWTMGWEKTKYWTAWAVLAYFLLNGAFTYWIWMVEKGIIFEGERSDGGKIRITTKTIKNIPDYHLTARYTLPSAPTNWQEIKLTTPFTRWFTADGHFVAKPFQQWLASEVPVIGHADPNNVVEEIGRGSGREASAASAAAKHGLSLDDIVQGMGSGANATGKKARRRV